MAKTYSRQVRVPPTGTSLFADGEGMHTRIAHDAPLALNNMYGYCNLTAGYCQDLSNSGRSTVDIDHTDSEERYIAQVPTIVPRGAAKMVWTAGVDLNAPGAGNSADITRFDVYLSSAPYTGSATAAFDSGLLGIGNQSNGVAGTPLLTASNGTNGYQLVDASGAGIANPLGYNIFDGVDTGAFLVLTYTGEDTGSGEPNVWVYDFSWWFLPE